MSFSTRVLFLGSTFAASFAAGSACKFDDKNANHCVHNEGDAYCVEKHGAERGFCGGGCVDSEDNDGCVADAPSDLSCYSPCGDDKYADEDDSCLDTSTMTETNASTMDSSDDDPSGDPTTMDDSSSVTMTGDETETDPSDTTGPSGCQVSDDCTNADNPVCLDNECVPCTETPDGDLACNSKDETMPVCNDAGQCVQCTDGNTAACGDTTPVCDDGSSTCVGCTYHEQCSDSACSLATGACMDGVVLHVDGDAGCPGSGTEGAPYCDIQLGIDAVGGEGVVIVHATPGSYSEDLQVEGSTIAILGTDGTPVLENNTATSTLVMTGGTTQLYVEGLRFANNNSAVALSLSDGEAWLDRVEVVSNLGAGSGVEALAGADVHLRSSIVGRNGEDGNPATFGVNAEGAMTELTLENVTAVANLGTAGTSLTCDGSAAVTVRNSIVARTSLDSVGCSGATVTYSAIDTDLAGAGNVVLDSFDTGWFEEFFSNDLRLSPSGETQFEDIALVEAGDYPFDIEGEPRPAPGSMDHAGADTP
jgi:hypothetical protein